MIKIENKKSTPISIPNLKYNNYDLNSTYEFGFNYIRENYNVIPKVDKIKIKFKRNKTEALIKLLQDIANKVDKESIFISDTTYDFYNDKKDLEIIKSIQGDGFIIVMRCLFSVLYEYLDETCVTNEPIYIFSTPDSIIHQHMDEIKETLKGFSRSIKKPKIKGGIHIIKMNNGFYTDYLQLKKSNVDLKKHYNDDFIAINDLIMKHLEEEQKGLFLLHGKAGTGKTSFIRHLSNMTSRKFIFLPPNLANELSSPAFVDFLINNKGCILVIEDAENILHKRSAGSSQSMSNLLNITDGLLSDIMNITVICTFNSSLTDIDVALQRKGRLTGRYEFNELSLEKTQALAKTLNIEGITKPMVLTDIFNYEEESFVKERARVGFGN